MKSCLALLVFMFVAGPTWASDGFSGLSGGFSSPGGDFSSSPAYTPPPPDFNPPSRTQSRPTLPSDRYEPQIPDYSPDRYTPQPPDIDPRGDQPVPRRPKILPPRDGEPFPMPLPTPGPNVCMEAYQPCGVDYEGMACCEGLVCQCYSMKDDGSCSFRCQ